MKRPFIDKSWWNNMSANFAGAFLGIVVTFGTTAVIDMHARKSMARRRPTVCTVSSTNGIPTAWRR